MTSLKHSHLVAVSITAVLFGPHQASSQVGPRRTDNIVTLYATTGTARSCSLPGGDPRLTLALEHRRDLRGNLVPFSVPPRQKLVITDIEFRVVTDAAKDIHLALYASTPGSSYFGHPGDSVPVVSDNKGQNVGVAIGKGSWSQGVVFEPGQVPCVAEILGAPLWKDPGSTGTSGFAYVIVHGYLTSK